jgi:hypothetical protein
VISGDNLGNNQNLEVELLLKNLLKMRLDHSPNDNLSGIATEMSYVSLFTWLLIVQPTSILEFGSGLGTLTKLVKRTVPEITLLGIETDLRLCSYLQLLFPNYSFSRMLSEDALLAQKPDFIIVDSPVTRSEMKILSSYLSDSEQDIWVFFENLQIVSRFRFYLVGLAGSRSPRLFENSFPKLNGQAALLLLQKKSSLVNVIVVFFHLLKTLIATVSIRWGIVGQLRKLIRDSYTISTWDV